MDFLYAIALGSNRRGRYGSPAETVRAAAAAIGAKRLSRVRLTPALGPAGRGFANAIALVASDLDPPALLTRMKRVERDFGRRGGRRWGPRVLDLDIILWSQGAWGGDGLIIPHPEFRRRAFVLQPLAEIAPAWRDPITGATIRQLLFRLGRRRGVPSLEGRGGQRRVRACSNLFSRRRPTISPLSSRTQSAA